MIKVQSLLTVKDLVKGKLTIIGLNSSVYDSAKKMKENKVTSVLVKNSSGKIVGIVTNIDIIYKIVATNANPQKIKVGNIMTKNLLTIEGDESMFTARQIMLDKKVKHLIVTNKEHHIGIVTTKEIMGE